MIYLEVIQVFMFWREDGIRVRSSAELWIGDEDVGVINLEVVT